MSETRQQFLYSFDPEENIYQAISVTRKELSEAPFLDERFLQDDMQQTDIPLSEISNQSCEMENQLHFIFHTSFCCSTLMARLLDVAGKVVSLKEPQVIVDLSKMVRQPPARHDTNTIIQKTLHHMARFVEPEYCVIKPTNIANNLLPEALAIFPNTKALLMYSNLREFLISVLKKGEDGLRFTRMVFDVFATDTGFYNVLSMGHIIRMTDLEVAALAWHLQIDYFRKIIEHFGTDRIRTLHHRALLDAPNETMAKTVDFLGLPLTQTDIDAAINGPAFKIDSKQGDAFSPGIIKKSSADIEKRYGAELDKIIAWCDAFEAFQPHDTPLTAAL